MGRRLLLLTVSVALLHAGCGSDEQIPDSDVIEALELEQGPEGDGYMIGGDPFCAVGRILNDRQQVEAAVDGGERGLVIADSDRRVGVEAVPPFDPKCARQARRALDELLE